MITNIFYLIHILFSLYLLSVYSIYCTFIYTVIFTPNKYFYKNDEFPYRQSFTKRSTTETLYESIVFLSVLISLLSSLNLIKNANKNKDGCIRFYNDSIFWIKSIYPNIGEFPILSLSFVTSFIWIICLALIINFLYQNLKP